MSVTQPSSHAAGRKDENVIYPRRDLNSIPFAEQTELINKVLLSEKSSKVNSCFTAESRYGNLKHSQSNRANVQSSGNAPLQKQQIYSLHEQSVNHQSAHQLARQQSLQQMQQYQQQLALMNNSSGSVFDANNYHQNSIDMKSKHNTLHDVESMPSPLIYTSVGKASNIFEPSNLTDLRFNYNASTGSQLSGNKASPPIFDLSDSRSSNVPVSRLSNSSTSSFLDSPSLLHSLPSNNWTTSGNSIWGSSNSPMTTLEGSAGQSFGKQSVSNPPAVFGTSTLW
ncbi:uncharacterized protein PRCAT00000419001 [Priceomyces carsonii]|uniref:uncharacterized protein n=1 Tax=Priceomyces carsonii TaxID=28549 RepID=UPI002ED85648|nr:unnamed protein product [Priceomyces carsonii]